MCITYCVVCAIVQKLLTLVCEIVAFPFKYVCNHLCQLCDHLCQKRPDANSVEHDPLLGQFVITVDLSRNHLPTGTETMPIADTMARTA